MDGQIDLFVCSTFIYFANLLLSANLVEYSNQKGLEKN